MNKSFHRLVMYILGSTYLVITLSACNPSNQSNPDPGPAPAAKSARQPSVAKSLDEVYVYSGLIELKQVDPSFVIDLKNATADNITGMVQYEHDLCLINIDAAKRLMKAQKLAMADGYRIKIWDAYRPLSVQAAMNASLPDDKKHFVPAPSNSSQHCRGIAVDITLVDENGDEIDMPTDYYEFTKATYPNYKGATEMQTKNREYLKSIMAKAGFKVLSVEWWHYYLPSYKNYERLDVKLDDYLQYREANAPTPAPISSSPSGG
ncbi:MAG: M15 family metallopeptidase [Armatimonadota bacterium]